MAPFSSRVSGFFRLAVSERLAWLRGLGRLDAASVEHLGAGGGLPAAHADRMSENVVATHALPLSLGLNFRVNGRDVLIPMSIEEPSVVAAASNAARIVRASGGFFGEATRPVMTAQIQLDDVADTASVEARVAAARADILACGDAAIPRMVQRGGGCCDLDVRVLDAASLEAALAD